MTISSEFQEVLRAGRPDFNARTAEARHRYPSFNSELFGQFLTHSVDPFVAAAAPERRGIVASAAYDVALELVGRELAGGHARGQLLDRLWQEVLPALVGILPDQPAPMLCALCNALLNLQAQGARAEQWLQLLLEQAPKISGDALPDFGVLAAWRAGAVQFRVAALRLASAHPQTASAILGLSEQGELAEQLPLLESDPWLLTPGNADVSGHEVGSFTGYGGHFPIPPSVRACAAGFMVKSEDRYFLLLADSFGALLLPASADEYLAAADYQAPASPAPNLIDGGLHTLRGRVEHSFCRDDLQLDWNEHSAALYSPYSFSIYVVPWR